MYPDNYDARHLPDGWATFLRGLEVRDARGRPVEVRPAGLSRWSIPAQSPRPLRLHYEVLVHHDQGSWPVGWDEAAYAKRACDCVFLTGMAVFVGARDLADIDVRFRLPNAAGDRPAWRSVTPWRRLQGRDAYRAHGFQELSEVALVVGDMPVRAVRRGGTEVEVAVGRDIEGGADLFATATEDYLDALSDLLGPPPEGRFAVIANLDVFTGGGAFIRSVSMLFRDPPSWEQRDRWGHILAHELVHLWNGHTLRFDTTEEWFKEGATDYLSRLVQVRAGHLTAQGFFDDIAEGYPWYLREAGRSSLADAGARKQELETLVYRGGFYAALMLDMQLRKATAGRAGLPDLVARLYEEALPAGRRVTLDDLADAGVALGAPSLGDWLRELVTRPDPLPIRTAIRELGFELSRAAGATWVAVRVDGAPDEARALRAALLGSG